MVKFEGRNINFNDVSNLKDYSADIANNGEEGIIEKTSENENGNYVPYHLYLRTVSLHVQVFSGSVFNASCKARGNYSIKD